MAKVGAGDTVKVVLLEWAKFILVVVFLLIIIGICFLVAQSSHWEMV